MICGTGASSITERSLERLPSLPSENANLPSAVKPAVEMGRNAVLPDHSANSSSPTPTSLRPAPSPRLGNSKR